METSLHIMAFVFGCVISTLTFWHDVHRHEIARKRPARAPMRIPPGVHLLAAALTGWGAWQMLDPATGSSVAALHLVMAYVVVRPLIER